MSYTYQKYYDLYCALYKKLTSEFPAGMTNPFPDNWLRSKVFGISDSDRDWRQVNLDLWIRELLVFFASLSTCFCRFLLLFSSSFFFATLNKYLEYTLVAAVLLEHRM